MPETRAKTGPPASTGITGFNASRLRKLQLERAAYSKSDSAASAYEYSNKSSERYVRNNSDPIVYVVPDCLKGNKNQNEVPEKSLTSTTWMEKPDFPVQIKYPHGMPRWGPRLVSTSQDSTKNEDTSLHQMDDDESHGNCTKSTKSSKIRDAEENARVQSTLAAARAARKFQTSSSEETDSQQKKKKTSGLVAIGSRLLGRGKPSSLLQSAKSKQSRVMEVGTTVRTSHNVVSLDDPDVCGNETMQGGTQSLKEFEYLHEEEEETIHEGSSCCDSVESEEECDASRSDEQSTASESKSVCQSWSMDSNDSQNNDSVSDSSASSQKSPRYDPPSLWQRAKTTLNFPQQPSSNINTTTSSVPTLASSEEDQESRHSDLFVDTRDVLNDKEGSSQEEDFFDAALEASPSEEQKDFNVRRCRELLFMRDKHLETEQRKKLLSPAAARKLAQTPPLLQIADERAIRELASRGRWLYSRQERLAKSTISSSLCSNKPANTSVKLRLDSMPDDVSSELEPFKLVTPTVATPMSTRQDLWHRRSESHEEAEEPKDEKYFLQLGNLTLALSRSEKRAAKLSYYARLRNFTTRWTPLFLSLLWMARSMTLLGEALFPAIHAVSMNRRAISNNVEDQIQFLVVNHSLLVPATQSITQFSSANMPVLKVKKTLQQQHEKPIVEELLASAASETRPKCFENQSTFFEHSPSSHNVYMPLGLPSLVFANIESDQIVLGGEAFVPPEPPTINLVEEFIYSGSTSETSSNNDFEDNIPLGELFGDMLLGNQGGTAPWTRRLNSREKKEPKEKRVPLLKQFGEKLQQQSQKLREARRQRRKMLRI